MKSQHPIRLIPREGAAHPVFRDLRDDQALELFLLYQQLLQPEADSFAQQQAAITQWHATLHQRLTQLLGADPDYLWETNPAVMRLVIPRQPRPQQVLNTVVECAGSFPLGVREIIISAGDLQDSAVINNHRRDPRQNRLRAPRSNDDLWLGSFSPGPAILGTVAEDIGIDVLADDAGVRLPELRVADPYFDNIRVVGYLPAIEDAADTGDPLAHQLADALTHSFLDQWPRGIPVPPLLNRSGSGAFDHVSAANWQGRQHAGFVFAIARDPACLTQLLIGTFRHRETEMLTAIVDAIGPFVARGALAPVLHWERTPNVYIFNLWRALS